jgi:uncharacterized protein (DUF2267 family)
MFSKRVDPLRITQDVLAVIAAEISPGESEKVKRILPAELQSLWPEFAPQTAG